MVSPCPASGSPRRRIVSGASCCIASNHSAPEHRSGAESSRGWAPVARHEGATVTGYSGQERSAPDHRDLNADMSIFATDPMIGTGLPLWLPAGAVIRQELEQLAREIAQHDGCLPVYSPFRGRGPLYERPGTGRSSAATCSPPYASAA